MARHPVELFRLRFGAPPTAQGCLLYTPPELACCSTSGGVPPAEPTAADVHWRVLPEHRLFAQPTRVTKLYALEPNSRMIALAERARNRTTLDIEYLELPGERIPLEDESVNSEVSTFTLGTIPDVLTAVRGMRRVLRTDGRLIFFELGLSSDPPVRRWQEWWDPVAHWLFEGLHLTREIPSILREGGFEVETLETTYLAPFPKSWTFCVWGTAKVSNS